MTSEARIRDAALENTGRSSRKANPVDVHVGSRIRFRRMLLGMSQETLGELLGLTFQQVQKYEKGANRVGASRLFELARVLNVPVQFFFDEMPLAIRGSAETAPGMAEPPSDSYFGEFLNTREGLELNKAFAKITDQKVRRAVVDLVRSMAGNSE